MQTDQKLETSGVGTVNLKKTKQLIWVFNGRKLVTTFEIDFKFGVPYNTIPGLAIYLFIFLLFKRGGVGREIILETVVWECILPYIKYISMHHPKVFVL